MSMFDQFVAIADERLAREPRRGRENDGQPRTTTPRRAMAMATIDPNVASRLEYLRSQIDAECISYSEIAELESMAEYIESGDTQLMEWAGVQESDAW